MASLNLQVHVLASCYARTRLLLLFNVTLFVLFSFRPTHFQGKVDKARRAYMLAREVYTQKVLKSTTPTQCVENALRSTTSTPSVQNDLKPTTSTPSVENVLKSPTPTPSVETLKSSSGTGDNSSKSSTPLPLTESPIPLT